MSKDERLQMLIKACVELISKEAPKWEYIASLFFAYELHNQIDAQMQKLGISSFHEKIKYLEEEGYYGDYIRKHYSDEEIDSLQAYIQDERDALFTFSGLELVEKTLLDLFSFPCSIGNSTGNVYGDCDAFSNVGKRSCVLGKTDL